MRIKFLIAGFSCSLLLSGCGGSTSSSQSTLNVAGNWQFTAKSNLTGGEISATGQITQNGNNISAQLNLSGSPCATTASATGTLNGTSLSIGINENGQVVAFTGTVAADGNSANGTYQAPSGGCTNGDNGTWTGNRVSIAGAFMGSMRADGVSAPVGVTAALKDDGGSISGNAAFTNSACLQSIGVTGRASGLDVQLRGDSTSDSIVIRGKYDQRNKSLVFTYVVEEGACAGESGNGVLTKIP
jgi:hypothetical protein